MDRRQFLGWVGLGMVASSLPVAIAACSDNTSTTTASPEISPVPNTEANVSPSSESFQKIGTVAELDKGPLLVTDGLSEGPVLVVRDPANPDNLIAVNPTCTHAGCTVNWEAGQNKFACPCHGSQFGPDGQVLQGPAKNSLTTYAAKIEDAQVLVNQG